MTRPSNPNMPRSSAESGLVERARLGDVAAFERLLAEHLPRVRRFARSMCGSDADADDLAQDALLKAYASIGAYRLESAFSTWLFRIVRNTCIDHARRAQVRRVQDREPLDACDERHVGPEAGAEETVAGQQLRALLQEGLRALPLEFRSAVVLFEVEGLGQDEVAAIEGVPVGTVKSRLSRGRKQLREWLVARGMNELGNVDPSSRVQPERAVRP